MKTLKKLIISLCLIVLLGGTALYVLTPLVIEKKLAALGYPDADIEHMQISAAPPGLRMSGIILDEKDRIASASLNWVDQELKIDIAGLALNLDPERFKSKEAKTGSKIHFTEYLRSLPLSFSLHAKGDATILDVPFKDVTLAWRGSKTNSQHKITLRGATQDNNARIVLDAGAQPEKDGGFGFEGKTDISADKLEQLGIPKIAGSGKFALRFKGSFNQTDGALSALSVTTAEPVNFKGKLADKPVDIHNLSVSLTHSPESAPPTKGRIEASTFSLPGFDEYLIPLSFAFDLSGDIKDTVKFDGQISDPNGVMTVTLEGDHAVPKNEGRARFKTPGIQFTPGVHQPGSFFPFLKKRTEEVTGLVSAKGTLAWGPDEGGVFRVNGTADVLTQNLGGKFGAMEVSGINGVTAFNNLNPPATAKDQMLSIAALNAGLPLTNGVIKFTLKPGNALSISDFNWDLAGGKLRARPFDVSLESPDIEVTLEAETLDLKQLFEMATLEGLEATGLVTGTVPIAFKDGKISIKDGILSAPGDGTIRYNPQDPPAFLAQTGNPGLDTLKGALQNFHFTELSLKVSGDSGGEQKVTLQAKGNNPEFQGGFPVNINLNLEGALESVLKNKPGGGNIPEAVRKQIEAYEEKNAQ